MQLNKAQYTILMTIARSRNSMACYARRDCAHKAIPSDPDWSPILYRLMQVNAETPIPCDAPLWVERHYQSPHYDRLQEKQDRQHRGVKPQYLAAYRALYKLGQGYERIILHARQTRNPDDYDPALAYETIARSIIAGQDDNSPVSWYSYYAGRNSIREARGLELLNH